MNDELYGSSAKTSKLHRSTLNPDRRATARRLSTISAVAETQTALKTSQAQAEPSRRSAPRWSTSSHPDRHQSRGFAVENRQQRGERPIPPCRWCCPRICCSAADIARAEREMAAANAQIGVAIAPTSRRRADVGHRLRKLCAVDPGQSHQQHLGIAFSLFQQIFNAAASA